MDDKSPIHHPSRRPARAWLAAALVMVFLLTAACTGDDGPPGTATPQLAVDLPQSPTAAAEALVDQIFGADEEQAQAAVVETLRRAGLAVVSAHGPVVAMPDAYAIGDVPVYAELIPILTGAVRAGDHYTFDQYLQTLTALGLPTKGFTIATVTAAMRDWGKGDGDAPVLVSAAASVRALSGRRGQVLYPGADPARTYLDPLQYLILVAHSAGTFVGVKPGAAPHAAGRPGLFDRLVGGGVAYADSGCTALKDLLKTDDAVTKGNVDFLKGQLKDRLLDMMVKEGTKDAIGKVEEVASKVGAVLSSALLMLGARLKLTADKTKTHFKHQKGSESENVTLTAAATFDIKVALEKLDCYALAGVTIPKPGPMPDMVIRWSSHQPQRGTIQKGGDAYLQAVAADSDKLVHGGITDRDGKSTLELNPPREEPAGKGEELHGQASFTANLDLKASFPFEPGDIYGFLLTPYGAAISKSFDIIKEALTRAGLPSQSITIDVDYHGSDIILAQGANSVNLILASIPKVYIDLVSCKGLEGPFKGVGGYVGATTSGGLQFTGGILGVKVPKSTAGSEKKLSIMTNPGARPAARFAIVPGDGGPFLDGEIRLFPEQILKTDAVILNDHRVGRPVGEVELLLAGNSYPFSDLTWPIARVTHDDRCADVEYIYD